MTNENNQELIARINRQLDATLGKFCDDVPFALLDFPDYPNVGDSAIWLGSIAYFARQCRTPSFVSRMSAVDVTELNKTETIFLNGGGNFGDIWSEYWPNSQAFREAVIERFRSKLIIQLPQSIHFKSQKNADRAARAIEAHRRFILLVRDEQSYDFATRTFQCEVHLCPDMAFALGPINRSKSPGSKTLFLMRNDLESAHKQINSPDLPDGIDLADWIEEPSWTALRAMAKTFTQDAIHLHSSRQNWLKSYFSRKAEVRLQRGVKLLSSYKYVVSDRLHTHILCTLLGIPHTIIDNNYGKLSGFVSTFSTSWNEVRRSNDLNESIKFASAIT